MPKARSGVVVESNIASRFWLARQLIHTFRSEVKGEVGKTIEGGGGSLQTVAGEVLPLHPLIGYFIAD